MHIFYCKTPKCLTDGKPTFFELRDEEPIESSRPTRIRQLAVMPIRSITCPQCGQTYDYNPAIDAARVKVKAS
jgi:hypothetical protein